MDQVISPKIIQIWEFIMKKIYAVENMIIVKELYKQVNVSLISAILLLTLGNLIIIIIFFMIKSYLKRKNFIFSTSILL